MGYTHYWEPSTPTDAKTWERFTRIVDRIKEKAGVELDDESGPERVFLNGIGEDSHETFVIGRETTGFNFCKTARKPYDSVVVGCLEAAKRLGMFDWSSDGSGDEHADGIALCEEAMSTVPA
jgi:hypothetical protein